MTRQERGGEGKKVAEKKTQKEKWDWRFKCPHGFTQLPWQGGCAGG